VQTFGACGPPPAIDANKFLSFCLRDLFAGAMLFGLNSFDFWGWLEFVKFVVEV
jgi:hypothetical protein